MGLRETSLCNYTAHVLWLHTAPQRHPGATSRAPSSGLRWERISLCLPACLPSTGSAVSIYYPRRKQPLFQKRHDPCLLSFAFLNGRHNSCLTVQLSNDLLHPKPLENSLSSSSCPADGAP